MSEEQLSDTVRWTRQGPLAVVTVDNPPVNAIGASLREGLLCAAARADGEEGLSAVLLRAAGRTFPAGADVREFGRPLESPTLPEVCARIEQARVPWAALLHGTALGGGLELALACAWRLALPGTEVGLPEVGLGLLPGAGGTVRLPRLTGTRRALELITTGRRIAAEKAAALGIIDRIVADEAAAGAALRELASAARPPALTERPVTDDLDDWEGAMAGVRARARGARAPVEAAEAVRDAARLPAPDALARERERFLSLRADPQSAALRHIFFAERRAARPPVEAPPRPFDHVGVVGGGTMGSGIATACLLAGRRVTLAERDQEAAEAARARIAANLEGAVSRGKLTPEGRDAALARLATAPTPEALAPVDLVIEAVFEDMDVKREVFATLDRVTRPEAVLATNTSYLDVNRLARSVGDPSRVIGLHFFSPAHVMRLLEIVRPGQVADDVLATGFHLARALGKQPVLAGVCDGFIGNRILARWRLECDLMLVEGALPEQVDAAHEAFGFAMGPYKVQDLAGLDIAWAMRRRRAAEGRADPRQPAIADRLCEAGRFGRKTGRGWYDHSEGSPRPDPAVEREILAESAARGVRRRKIAADEIMNRVLAAMADEGRAILDEGIAARAGDIDVVMVNGYGFPRWRGGPMYMAGITDS